MPEVAAAAKEAGEEVEGIMAASTAAAPALFVLRESFVTILVVDFAEFGSGETVVGVGYLNEFLGGRFVAPVD